MKKVFLFLVLFTATLRGEIIEIHSLDEVDPYIYSGQLIVFDIDNTLMYPKQQLGSHRWFLSRLAHYENNECEPQFALEKALDEWTAIQSFTEVRMVEPFTSSIVRDLQEQGRTVMGMTTRGLSMARFTLEQLGSLKIHLDITAPTSREHFFYDRQGVLFRNGILFTAGTHKGRALFHFLDEIRYHPLSVLYIDDEYSHLEEVEKICQERQIDFIGLRYGHLDEQDMHFSKELTDMQLQHFGKLISDEEAEDLLIRSQGKWGS